MFSLAWLAFPAVGLAAASPSASRVALVALAAATFAAIYLRTLWRTAPATARDIAPATVALGAIATALTLADRPSWALLFVLVATMAGLTLAQREAMVAIVTCALVGGLDRRRSGATTAMRSSWALRRSASA